MKDRKAGILLYASNKASFHLLRVPDNLIRKTSLSKIETQDLRIRLVAFPKPRELDEFDFRQFRIGEIYDLPPHFASVLRISGCAEAVALPQQRETAADSGRRKAPRPPQEIY